MSELRLFDDRHCESLLFGLRCVGGEEHFRKSIEHFSVRKHLLFLSLSPLDVKVIFVDCQYINVWNLYEGERKIDFNFRREGMENLWSTRPGSFVPKTLIVFVLTENSMRERGENEFHLEANSTTELLRPSTLLACVIKVSPTLNSLKPCTVNPNTQNSKEMFQRCF